MSARAELQKVGKGFDLNLNIRLMVCLSQVTMYCGNAAGISCLCTWSRKVLTVNHV